MEVETHLIKLYNMSMEQTSVHQLKTEKGIHQENKNVIWNIDFHFFDEKIQIKGEYFLSSAMDKIREIIEPKGYRVLVKCADYDAAHSGMQADMSAGSKIYKLTLLDGLRKQMEYKKKPVQQTQFHVFDESDIKSVATLEKQKEYRNDYFESKRKLK